MKAITIVAGLAGTVAAGHAHKHARHHARDTASPWPEWDAAAASATTTTTTTTSSSSTAWSEWDPASSTTTTTSASTWGEWDAASSSTTTTTTTSSTSAWDEWDSATSAAATTTGWGADPAVCVQEVIYITGPGTWAPDAGTTSTLTSTSTTTVTVSPTAPVPIYTSWTATGTYTIPESTVTVETTITVPAPTSAALTSGWNTFGGVTTTVTDTTTITVPYASWSADSTTTTPVIATTVFTCPNGGVYTIAPSSASVSVSTVTVYPVPATYTPGTYTQSATTVTVTDTSSIFVYPWSQPTSAPAASGTWSAPATWSASPSASPSAGSWGSGSGTLGSSANGNTWAMTYSPYTSAGGCKDAGTVSSDIASIAGKGFTTVRVYSTDCSTLANIGSAARANNLKLILGVFISSTGISGAQGQVTDIIAWAQWDLVELVVVGNEAVFNGYCSASALAGFVSSVKGELSGAGYKGPVTTTEPIDTWLSSGSTFCGVVDVVAANLYAFFNAQTTADQAGPFIQSEIGELDGVCPGKDVYVMETGWPHAGNCNGAACPSPANQVTAINSIKNVVGAQVVFFSYEDDAWKAPGQFDVEQYWGCADVFPGN